MARVTAFHAAGVATPAVFPVLGAQNGTFLEQVWSFHFSLELDTGTKYNQIISNIFLESPRI